MLSTNESERTVIFPENSKYQADMVFKIKSPNKDLLITPELLKFVLSSIKAIEGKDHSDAALATPQLKNISNSSSEVNLAPQKLHPRTLVRAQLKFKLDSLNITFSAEPVSKTRCVVSTPDMACLSTCYFTEDLALRFDCDPQPYCFATINSAKIHFEQNFMKFTRSNSSKVWI